MKVTIDEAVCQGHGRCYVLAPGLFVDDDEGYGQVKAAEEVPEEALPAAHAARQACPEGAVRLS